MLSPGMFFSWKYRNDGKFKISVESNCIVLLYRYKGEWIKDSVHESEQQASGRIAFLCDHQSRRPVVVKYTEKI